jgi:tetratricopeptide (TPR) repeat protein
MARANTNLPANIAAIANALMALSRREGMSRTAIALNPELLQLARGGGTKTSDAEDARAVEDAIKRQVNSFANLRDRRLLRAGLNLDGLPIKSFEGRITEVLINDIGERSPHYLDPESATGYYRATLIPELAWRLAGGKPVNQRPNPPADFLALAARYVSQHQTAPAISTLRQATETHADEPVAVDAWRELGNLHAAANDFDAADAAFATALALSEPVGAGEKLAMAIDRYAKRLTELEQYDRARAITSRALAVFIEGRWLWRRYAVIAWYVGDFPTAYAAINQALHNGYDISRVLHVRGQVLAEWGRHEDALVDLDEALRIPRSAHSKAIARSARAYTLGMTGNIDTALREFEKAERDIPQSSWLHYWRGLCLKEDRQNLQAAEQFRRSLQTQMWPLGPHRRHQVAVHLASLAE